MHEDYSSFREEDFIADEYFQLWVKSPDAETNAFWESWLAAHPQKKGVVMAAKAFLENLSFQAFQTSPQQVEVSLAQSLEKIARLEEGQTSLAPPKQKRIRALQWLVAAVMIGCIAITVMVARKEQSMTIDVMAGPQEVKTIYLPDSSKVTLNAGSQLTYASTLHSADIREVWLDGEAFFDVTHIGQANGKKRFIVHTRDMDIEVLGTTFNVKKLDGVTNVSLNSGKIKLALKDDPESVIYLQPGDFVRYSAPERRMLKKKVSVDLYSGWKENKISVDNMPLLEITRLLEDTYGYNIQLESAEMGETKMSGTLHVKDENTLLETLAFVLNINITKKDSVLLFQSKN